MTMEGWVGELALFAEAVMQATWPCPPPAAPFPFPLPLPLPSSFQTHLSASFFIARFAADNREASPASLSALLRAEIRASE
jgi:hypothetical protein